MVDGRLRRLREDFREQRDHFLGLGQGLLTRERFFVREHLRRDEGIGIRDVLRNVEIEAPLDGSALGDNCLECSRSCSAFSGLHFALKRTTIIFSSWFWTQAFDNVTAQASPHEEVTS